MKNAFVIIKKHLKKLAVKTRKYIGNKKNAYHILIGGIIIIIIILLLLTLLISATPITNFIKILIIALYGGLVFIIVGKEKFMARGKKELKNKISVQDKKNSKRITKRKNKNKLKKILSITGMGFIIAGIGALIGATGFLIYIVIVSPNFDPENLYRKQATVIYDIEGEVLTKIGREIREKITYDDIPQVFLDAVIATEDARFFQHNGFDAPRFLSASVGQVSGQYAGGASTITMQVVKNNFTSVEQSITRKFTDIYLAIFKLEKNYTKEEILEFYVNTPYLGNNSYGIAEASRNYFGKEIADINLAEAALLAGLFQAPGAYDPYINPENAERRRTTVLYLMKRHGYISDEEESIANEISVESLLKGTRSRSNQKYQGYVDVVIEEAEEKTGYSPYNVPMKIYTNYRADKQDHLHDILIGETFTFPNDIVQTGIAVTDINTGAIIAIGNGRNRTGERLFNFATMMKRQIGSTAKPIFEYGVGMENNNWSTYTLFLDDVHSYSNGPTMTNWDNKYNGLLTTRLALAQSRNIPALRAFQQLKNRDILNFVTSLGITPEIEGGRLHEAHSIGAFDGASPLEMAAAYAAFGNGGYYIEPYTIDKIEYIDSNDIKIFNPIKTRVMSESTAFMITDILRYGVDSGLIGGGRVSGVQVAAKSGTTNFDVQTRQRHNLPSNVLNDLWYVGYSPDYAVGMWFGYERIDSNHYHTTANWSTRDRLFTTIARGIFTNTGNTFTVPNSVVMVEVEKETSPAMLASQFTPSNMRIHEYFKKGTEPTEVSPRFNTLPNPTNVDINAIGSDIKITWNHISIPSTLTNDLNRIFDQHKDKYVNRRIAYEKETLGDIGYNVYIKQNGKLSLLGWTKENLFTHRPLNGGDLTYVIKACYSIFKYNQSTGSEITISDTPYAPLIEVSLVGKKIINLVVNEPYLEPGIIVLENLINVTENASLTKTTTRMSDNQTIPNDQIDTSKPETYTIKYKITYKNELYEHTRTIIIDNDSD